MRARWAGYERLLRTALEAGYAVVGLDEWVATPPRGDAPCLILRHDVDQQPASALDMAAVERDLGVRATWYFRWCTAHPRVVERIAGLGAVGLHYETLSRTARAEGIREPTEALLERCREILCREVAAFEERFGATRSICPHGDTRAPAFANHLLLRGGDPAAFGVAFDGNEVMRGVRLAAWLTDRRGGERWKDDAEPSELFARRATPVFAVVHPNNWTSRVRAGVDRALRATLPDVGRRPSPVRTGSDVPPL